MQQFTILELFKAAKKHKKTLILANFVAIIAALIASFIPLLMPLVIDEILLDKPNHVVNITNLLFQKEQEKYVYVLVVLALILFLRFLLFVFRFLQAKLFVSVSEEITYALRERILRKLKGVSLSGYEFFGSAKAASLAVVDVGTIEEFLSNAVSSFIVSLLMIVAVGSILIAINWQLAIFILILNPFVAFVSSKIARIVSKLKKMQNKAYEEFQDSLSETLDLFHQVKAANLEDEFIQKIEQKAKIIKDKSINFKYKNEGATFFSYFLMFAFLEIIKSLGILSVTYGELGIGMMFAVFSYIWFIAGSSQEILRIQYLFYNAKAAYERVLQIFDLPDEPIYPNLKNPFSDNTTSSITLKNANFSYDDKNAVLKDINMHIKQGQKIAIIGESGSGKTTLAQILVGFYPLNSGELKFDEINVKEIGLNKVRENVSLVLQNPQLFNDTIANNITLGAKTDEKKLHYAVQIAQLSEFVENLPDKLQTQIGKNGIKLSGGQRQRLSIARMIVKEPKIVILDESTSALDVATESKLFNEIETYLKDKTAIIIAHRLSTIKNADYIYVLEKGKISEFGTKEELLRKNGIFFRYYMQNKGE